MNTEEYKETREHIQYSEVPGGGLVGEISEKVVLTTNGDQVRVKEILYPSHTQKFIHNKLERDEKNVHDDIRNDKMPLEKKAEKAHESVALTKFEAEIVKKVMYLIEHTIREQVLVLDEETIRPENYIHGKRGDLCFGITERQAQELSGSFRKNGYSVIESAKRGFSVKIREKNKHAKIFCFYIVQESEQEKEKQIPQEKAEQKNKKEKEL